MSATTKDYLITNLPDLFTQNDVYPSLMFFSNGIISYKSSLETLKNKRSLIKMLNAYSLDTNITTLTTLEAFNAYKNEKKDFLLYAFSIDKKDYKDIYSNYLLPASLKSDKNVLILNKNTANQALFSEINDIFDGEIQGFAIYENGESKSTLKCPSSIDRQAIKDYLFTFF